jgi:hypothetical protein
MKKTATIFFAGVLFFLISSCSKQNPVEAEGGLFTALSGRIENWTHGSGCRASFIRMVITTVASPDSGMLISIGSASIDASGNFTMTNITAPPDTLFNSGGKQTNAGLFSNYPVFFHGYTNPSLGVTDGSNNYIGYLIYANQSISVLPYVSSTAAVGDFTMMFQYSDRAIEIDSSSTGTTVDSMALRLTYHMSLKRGWNKIFAITTYVSTTERRATWTTDVPSTPGRWYICNRYFKGQVNLFK